MSVRAQVMLRWPIKRRLSEIKSEVYEVIRLSLWRDEMLFPCSILNYVSALNLEAKLSRSNETCRSKIRPSSQVDGTVHTDTHLEGVIGRWTQVWFNIKRTQEHALHFKWNKTSEFLRSSINELIMRYCVLFVVCCLLRQWGKRSVSGGIYIYIHSQTHGSRRKSIQNIILTLTG